MILKKRLAEKFPNLPTLVRGTLSIEDKALASLEGYMKWIITADHSVCGRGTGVETWLPGKVVDSHEWDSYGIELASRVFNTGIPSHRDEIEAIIDVVKGTKIDNHGAFITNQCGLHVHIEPPKNLQVLKELALILIVYEQEISKLHPPCRRHGHPATIGNLNSNRLGFLFNEDTLRWSKPQNFIGIDCSTHVLRYSESEVLGWAKNKFAEIRKTINDCKDVAALSKLMCSPADDRPGHEHGDRNRFVNFTYLCRGDEYAQTIEFRQARGTLAAEEIHHWVDFCVALVRLAEFHANNPGKFPIDNFESDSSSRKLTVDNSVSINRLMDAMGLSEAAREFWHHKSFGYAFYIDGDKDHRTDNEEPPQDDPLIEDEDGGEVGDRGSGDGGDGADERGDPQPSDDEKKHEINEKGI